MNFFSKLKLNFQSLPFFTFLFLMFSMIHAGPKNLTSLQIGEILFCEKNYKDAIPQYQQVLSLLDSEDTLSYQLLCRLLVCHLQLSNDQESLNLLSKIKNVQVNPNDLFYQSYLKGLISFQNQNYEETLSLISKIPVQELSDSFAGFIKLEKGRCLVNLNKLEDALNEFQSIPFYEEFSVVFYLAQLNLIKIHLRKQDLRNARLLIDEMKLKLPINHSLEIERLYLNGMIFFLEQDVSKAIDCFEKLVPKAMLSNSAWSFHLLSTLLLLYLKQLSNDALSLSELLDIFTKGQSVVEYFGNTPSTKIFEDLKWQELSEQWSYQKKKIKIFQCFQQNKWNLADVELKNLLNDNPILLSEKAELWFWRGFCAEKLHQSDFKKECYRKAYSIDPKSFLAPAAYFKIYSLQDYLHGNKECLKHLKLFYDFFPNHPLNIACFYIIALHYKKDFFSETGKLIKAKDFSSSVEAFEQCLCFYDDCIKNGKIKESNLSYFRHIHHQALLEKAKTLLTISRQSREGKKIIYLKYAQDHFNRIFKEVDFTLYNSIWSEGAFRLNQILEDMGEIEERRRILNQMVQVSKDFWLAKAWNEKGKIAQQSHQYDEALYNFSQAENCGASLLFNDDDKLDLLIQQSDCFKQLNQLDEAMRLLSEAVNAMVISSLRVKAMFLRAEIYELQGRNELALKQLHAVSLKEGEWAIKAKNKMEVVYGM